MSEWIFFFFRFLEDLEEGIFIQQTLDSVLMNEDGKQLMVGHLIIIKRGIVPFVLWLMMVVHCYQQWPPFVCLLFYPLHDEHFNTINIH